jgi:hypothetical protein
MVRQSECLPKHYWVLYLQRVGLKKQLEVVMQVLVETRMQYGLDG